MSEVIAATQAGGEALVSVTYKPKTISAYGLAGAEVVTVQYSANGTDFGPTGLTLTATAAQATLTGVGLYKITLPVTASNAKVFAVEHA